MWMRRRHYLRGLRIPSRSPFLVGGHHDHFANIAGWGSVRLCRSANTSTHYTSTHYTNTHYTNGTDSGTNIGADSGTDGISYSGAHARTVAVSDQSRRHRAPDALSHGCSNPRSVSRNQLRC